MTVESIKESVVRGGRQPVEEHVRRACFWMDGRPLYPTIDFLDDFARAGHAAANVTELPGGPSARRPRVLPSYDGRQPPSGGPLAPPSAATWRWPTLVAGGVNDGLPVFLGSYPFPRVDILHELSKHKALGFTPSRR